MKKFIYEFIAFVVIIYTIELCLVHFFSKAVIPSISSIEYELNQKVDILYFGDSVLFTSGSLPKELAAYLPGASVGMVAHAADSPVIYLDYCRYLSRLQHKPKLVIIPISMRDFSLIWEEMPGNQFKDEQFYFHFSKTPYELLLPLFVSFKIYNLYSITTNMAWHIPYVYKGKYLGVIEDFEGKKIESRYSIENMKKNIMIYYSYELNPHDFMLQSLNSISQTCKFSKILYYITPISFETGEKYIGKDFVAQTNKNIEVVKKSLIQNHASLLDLSHAVRPNGFYWADILYMNEHLRDEGRNIVAKSLANYIRIHHLITLK